MLILSILIFCNIVLSIIFKYFEKYSVDNLHAIIINYATSLIVAAIVLGSSPIPANLLDKPWFPYACILGFLFSTGFNILALSFQKAGVAITAIVSKMSLIISAGFAILYYSETLNLPKGIGIIAAILAIILVNLPNKDKGQESFLTNKYLWLPIITMVLSGIIEIILLVVEVEGALGQDGIIFTSSSFAIAGLLGLVFAIFRWFKEGKWFKKQDIIGGVILGIPNFFTIYLLLYLLKEGWEGSMLFPINSVGMLAFTVLVGMVLYNEKINLQKGIGLALSILAIILISYS